MFWVHWFFVVVLTIVMALLIRKALIDGQWTFPFLSTFFFLYMMVLSLAVVLKGYPSYHLFDKGIQLRSFLWRRTIPYEQIEAVTVLPFKQLHFGLRWAIDTHTYHVGIFPSERFGTIDVVSSSYTDQAVVLVLKKGRPVLFTPADPNRIAEMIEDKSRRGEVEPWGKKTLPRI